MNSKSRIDPAFDVVFGVKTEFLLLRRKNSKWNEHFFKAYSAVLESVFIIGNVIVVVVRIRKEFILTGKYKGL